MIVVKDWLGIKALYVVFSTFSTTRNSGHTPARLSHRHGIVPVQCFPLIYNVNIHQSVLLLYSIYIHLSPWNIGIVESLKPVPNKTYSVFVSFKLTLFPNKWFLV